jgi:hypothetical protein
VAAAAACGLAMPAEAGEAIWLELRQVEAFPFSTGDLRAAVEARLPLAGAPAPGVPVVNVRGHDGGPVMVASAGREQQVAVQGRSATEAARLVALAVLDVCRPLPAGTLVARAAAPPAAADAVAAATPAPAQPGGLTLALFPAAVLGLSYQGAAFEPTLDVGWLSSLALARGRLGVGLQLGVSRASALWDETRFTLQTLPVRIGPRWRWKAIEIAAGPVARLYRTRGIDGGSGIIAGGFVALRGAVALTRARTLAAVASLSVDGYNERLDFRVGQRSLLRSAHVMPWLGAGLQWGPR